MRKLLNVEELNRLTYEELLEYHKILYNHIKECKDKLSANMDELHNFQLVSTLQLGMPHSCEYYVTAQEKITELAKEYDIITTYKLALDLVIESKSPESDFPDLRPDDISAEKMEFLKEVLNKLS